MAALRKVEDPKRCRKCGIEKPRTDFYRVKSTVQGIHSYCKPCHNENSAAAQKKDGRKRARASVRRSHLKTKYGLSYDDFDRILRLQGGGCAICGREKPKGRGDRLYVDHCHATGIVRGLLCNCCNTSLGRFRDDPELLRKAALYLEAGGVPWRST